MSASNRGFRGRNIPHSDRKVFDQPENIGNRKTFDEVKIPPDNLGNKIDHDPIATFIHDGLGNSVDGEPSHLRSGVLSYILGFKERPAMRRPMMDPQNFANSDEMLRNTNSSVSYGKKKPPESKDAVMRRLPQQAKSFDTASGDDYMARLAAEFSKLLREKSGAAFSFSMKPITDFSIDEVTEKKDLADLKLVIEEVLKISCIDAKVSISLYCTNDHKFAVFFINPTERDPVKNKELISALRQVIKLHAKSTSLTQINILLVLANAQSVIESHLHKIGAKKTEG